jgi:hypothetical protein
VRISVIGDNNEDERFQKSAAKEKRDLDVEERAPIPPTPPQFGIRVSILANIGATASAIGNSARVCFQEC